MDLKAPYPPTTASLGGVPTVALDVPVCAVFLCLFILGAISHMTILQINKRRGHKFLMSGMLFGFCMSRIVSNIMRIVWATRPMNINVAIAANIFVYAGVVLLFVINLLFAQRIVRACHPHAGWHPILHWTFIVIYVLIVLTLCALISAIIDSFFTLGHNAHRIDRNIQLYGATFYCVISFLPIALVIGGLLLPRRTRLEHFGQGSFRTKVLFLSGASCLLCIGACFRCAVNYAGSKRPRTDPAPYQSKACFYIFNFTIEIIVVLFYVLVRVDKRFYVPDDSHKAGDYARETNLHSQKKAEKRDMVKAALLHRIISPEEVVFDHMEPAHVMGEPELEPDQIGEKTVQG